MTDVGLAACMRRVLPFKNKTKQIPLGDYSKLRALLGYFRGKPNVSLGD